MNFLAVFVPLFLIAFLLVPFLCYFVRIKNKRLAKLCPPGSRCQRTHQRNQNRRQINHLRSAITNEIDRQGNIFTISDETTGTPSANRYSDFFYLEPSSNEAARIRAQLEKDDKDLPSYEEVIRMTSSPTTPMTPLPPPPAAAAAAASTATTATTITIATMGGNSTTTTTMTSSNSSSMPLPQSPPDMIDPPSYSEMPPSYEASSSSSNARPATTSIATASTSRGAAITIPIKNSASNTSV